MIGTVLDERYKILDLVGQGSMSVVYKAEHQLMKRTVAIKMLQSHSQADPVSLKRFQQEAKAISALAHPNLVKVYDFGVTPQGEPYLVMDLVEGQSLAAILEKEQYLPASRAAAIALQACSALAHAHQHGIIHRDVKPANIMIAAQPAGDELVKVLDFGIARLYGPVSEHCQRLTQTGEIFGSPLYLSPELCVGREIDARSDIYSLGCVLFEMLAGKPPFSASTAMELVAKHLSEKPAWPTVSQPLPAQLKAAVERAMEKNPDRRFGSANELSKAIAPFSPGIPVTAVADAARAASKARQNLIWLACAMVIALAATATFVWLKVAPELQISSDRNTYEKLSVSLEPGDPRLIQAADKLAASLEKNGKSQEARAVLEGVETHLSKIVNSATEPEYNQKWFDKASRLLALQTSLHGADGKETAVTLRQIADYYRLKGDYAQAIPLYRQSIGIFEKHGVQGKRGMGWAYLNLGICYHKQGKFPEAIKAKEKGVELVTWVFGPTSVSVSDSLCNLATTYLEAHQYGKAQELFLRAIEQQLQAKKPSRRSIAEASVWLGDLLVKSAQYDQAEQHYLDAAEIYSDMRNWIAAGEIWCRVSICGRASNDFKKSEKAALTSLECFSNVSNVPPDKRANSVLFLNYARKKLGKKPLPGDHTSAGQPPAEAGQPPAKAGHKK